MEQLARGLPPGDCKPPTPAKELRTAPAGRNHPQGPPLLKNETGRSESKTRTLDSNETQ